MEQRITLQPVAQDVYVAPQLGPEHMAEVARAGFKAVVNNRPDFEAGASQPTNAEIEDAARSAGLQYRFLPVSGMYQSPEDAQAMAALLAELPRPLLLFCRSGARSARLYQLALQG
jgi:sulfide:quinone oxidoreductase